MIAVHQRHPISLDAEDLRATIDMTAAIRAIQQVAARGGIPRIDRRRATAVSSGQLLYMPAELGEHVGCKLLTLAPGNTSRGLDRIQGVFLLFDRATLTLLGTIDGAELTLLRTPAVSAALVDLIAEDSATTLGVFGTGPQALRHVEAIAAIRPISDVRVVGTSAEKSEHAERVLRESGYSAVAGSVEDVATADIIVCATSAAEPLFAADLVRPSATVVAVGSHEAHKRELPGALLGRSQVVVESLEVADTEAGDVIQAIAEGHLLRDGLVTFHEIASGAAEVDRGRTRVVKTCGVGWQDLAVAIAAVDAVEKESAR